MTGPTQCLTAACASSCLGASATFMNSKHSVCNGRYLSVGASALVNFVLQKGCPRFCNDAIHDPTVYWLYILHTAFCCSRDEDPECAARSQSDVTVAVHPPMSGTRTSVPQLQPTRLSVRRASYPRKPLAAPSAAAHATVRTVGHNRVSRGFPTSGTQRAIVCNVQG
jgi:hypothetical protein